MENSSWGDGGIDGRDVRAAAMVRLNLGRIQVLSWKEIHQ